ncbi:uncharacterized protein TM35_000491300, partial [Trypanosoma theileri]
MNTKNVNKNVKNEKKDTMRQEGRSHKIFPVASRVFSPHLMPDLLPKDQENEGSIENVPTAHSLAGLKPYSSIGAASASVARSHSLSTGRYKEDLLDNIEGELWYITPNTGPRKPNSIGANWVTCNTRHLMVYSSWGDQSRIIEAVHFDAIRILFSFSHVHKHKDKAVQVPMTVVSRQGQGKESSMSKRMQSQTGNQSVGVSRRRASRGSVRSFHARGGTTLPRYYYFGIEFRESNDPDDDAHVRRRRVMVFATDIKSDRDMWLRFFQEVLAVKKVSVSRKVNARSLSSTWFAPHSSPTKSAKKVVCSESDDGDDDDEDEDEEEASTRQAYAPLNYGETARYIGSSIDLDVDNHSTSSLRSVSQDRYIFEYANISPLQKQEEDEERSRKACIIQENYYRVLLRAIKDIHLSTHTSPQQTCSQLESETDQDELIQSTNATDNDIFLQTKEYLEPLQELIQTLQNNVETKVNIISSLREEYQRHPFHLTLLKNETETPDMESKTLQIVNLHEYEKQEQEEISRLRNTNVMLLEQLDTTTSTITDLQNKLRASEQHAERRQIEVE